MSQLSIHLQMIDTLPLILWVPGDVSISPLFIDPTTDTCSIWGKTGDVLVNLWINNMRCILFYIPYATVMKQDMKLDLERVVIRIRAFDTNDRAFGDLFIKWHNICTAYSTAVVDNKICTNIAVTRLCNIGSARSRYTTNTYSFKKQFAYKCGAFNLPCELPVECSWEWKGELIATSEWFTSRFRQAVHILHGSKPELEEGSMMRILSFMFMPHVLPRVKTNVHPYIADVIRCPKTELDSVYITFHLLMCLKYTSWETNSAVDLLSRNMLSMGEVKCEIYDDGAACIYIGEEQLQPFTALSLECFTSPYFSPPGEQNEQVDKTSLVVYSFDKYTSIPPEQRFVLDQYAGKVRPLDAHVIDSLNTGFPPLSMIPISFLFVQKECNRLKLVDDMKELQRNVSPMLVDITQFGFEHVIRIGKSQ